MPPLAKAFIVESATNEMGRGLVDVDSFTPVRLPPEDGGHPLSRCNSPAARTCIDILRPPEVMNMKDIYRLPA